MNKQIFDSHRRFVVITDPHIRAVAANPVYTSGINLEKETSFHRQPSYGSGYSLQKTLISDLPESSVPTIQSSQNFTNIWIKEANGSTLARDCWPGKSYWVDFLN